MGEEGWTAGLEGRGGAAGGGCEDCGVGGDVCAAAAAGAVVFGLGFEVGDGVGVDVAFSVPVALTCSNILLVDGVTIGVGKGVLGASFFAAVFVVFVVVVAFNVFFFGFGSTAFPFAALFVEA